MAAPQTNNYVDRFAAVMNSGDSAALRTLFDSNFHDHAPWPGQSPNVSGFEAGLARMRESFPDFAVEVLRTLCDGDHMTIHFNISGTHLGEFMGAPASGRTFSIDAIDIVRLSDGRIAEHWGVIDTSAMAEQLGL